MLANAPVHVATGRRVVEIRPQGVDKGSIVTRVLAVEPPEALSVAIGDDMTDESMFDAIPDPSHAVHVGPSRSRALWRARDPAAIRAVLRRIARSEPARRSEVRLTVEPRAPRRSSPGRSAAPRART